MGKVLRDGKLKKQFKNLDLIKQEDQKVKEDKKVVAGFCKIFIPEDKPFLKDTAVPKGGLGPTCLIDAMGKGIFWLKVSSFFILNIFNSFLYTNTENPVD